MFLQIRSVLDNSIYLCDLQWLTIDLTVNISVWLLTNNTKGFLILLGKICFFFGHFYVCSAPSHYVVPTDYFIVSKGLFVVSC